MLQTAFDIFVYFVGSQLFQYFFPVILSMFIMAFAVGFIGHVFNN